MKSMPIPDSEEGEVASAGDGNPSGLIAAEVDEDEDGDGRVPGPVQKALMQLHATTIGCSG